MNYTWFHFQDASDTSTNLIELDSSLSFEVDDFDPLNQNAKQLPPLPKKPPIVLPPSLPRSAPPNPRQAFDNPLYPHCTPQLRPPKPMTNSSNSTNNSDDDVVELLRKYGLDRFSLTSSKFIDTNLRNSTPNDVTTNNSNRTNDPFLDSTNTNGLKRNGDIGQPKTNNNWTTFDWTWPPISVFTTAQHINTGLQNKRHL